MKKYDQFVDWVRGTKMPKYLTIEEWAEWKQNARKAKPFRYWLATSVLGALEDAVKWPQKKVRAVRNYVSNRWINKTHYLPTRLKPGGYHEVDQRMLHGLFETLVDFVEMECAWMHVVWDDQQRKIYGPRGIRLFKAWRSAAAGVAHLEWSASLDDMPHQSASAKEILRLYRWWTQDRHKRPCPYDVSGWTDYCADRPWPRLIGKDRPQEEIDAMLKKISQLESQYEQEDTQMMIDLIKIRDHLWT